MTESVFVPDIGDYKDVRIVEVLVKPGDQVSENDPLIALETDKATMEVPSPMSGTVRALEVAVGATVNQGSLILSIEPTGRSALLPPGEKAPSDRDPRVPDRADEGQTPSNGGSPLHPVLRTTISPEAETGGTAEIAARARPAPHPLDGLPPHATPSLRKQARELGVDLAKVGATGPKNRITREDLLAFVKAAVQAPPAAARGTALGLDLPPWPIVDFAKYGPVERQPLSRIKAISGANLARNSITIPHVTNFDEADVTEAEAFRQAINAEAKDGLKATLLAFAIKAVVATLKAFPSFNASLDGDALVLKRYFHIGFAADTPRGLLVPVLRDADQKGIREIAAETATLAKEARDGKLRPEAMQGGSFSISSLGGIGGTGFTPIINAPEVAILGLAKAAMKPVWDGSAFQARLILPLSLSWDHRVVDGAEAGRFLVHLGKTLGDIRRLLL